MHTRLRDSDRHARLGISIRCGAHELKSILMRRANSEYVCMYVCMFETSERVCLRGGSDSLRKTFSIECFIQFFEFCEGVLLEA